jgi:hypothetical protein
MQQYDRETKQVFIMFRVTTLILFALLIIKILI